MLANIKDGSSVCPGQIADRVAFWEQCAKKLEWFTPWKQALVWDKPFAKWFVGQQENSMLPIIVWTVIIKANLGNKTALIWEGENGDEKIIHVAIRN